MVGDILGRGGRAMLSALIEDPDADPAKLAQHLAAPGPLRNKIPRLALALKGKPRDHHRFMLKQPPGQADYPGKRIDAFGQRIDRLMSKGGGPFAAAARRPDPVPGINRRAARAILAGIGRDMSRFPSAAHLAGRAGLCPGSDESAGKRRGGRARFGNRRLEQTLVQCAWAAARTQRGYSRGMYRRLKGRRGHKRALIAVAHAVLTTIRHPLSRASDYADLGTVQRHAPDPQRLTKHLLERLQQLGYSVTLTPAA